MNITLIGAGNIGFRHFQSLIKLTKQANLFVCDKQQSTLDKCNAYFKENPNTTISVEYLSKLNQLPSKIDYAIIATTSLVRLEVCIELLKLVKVKRLIFEKFLFPKLSHYVQAKEILEQHKVLAFVNCPMRLWPTYLKIKELLNSSLPTQFQFVGSNWGLGCNSIHYIDLFSFLTNQKEFHYSNQFLLPKILESKRSGYKEFGGTLVATNSRGDFISLTSLSDGKLPNTITISNREIQIVIEESFSNAFYRSHTNGWTAEQIKLETIFQSNLTHKIIENLENNLPAGIPSFHESAQLHQDLLKTFIQHQNIIQNTNDDTCIIT